MPNLYSIINKIGIDKAIAYSAGARIIQAITGIGTLFFIASFLTGEEQGFYYTFGSVLAFQVFFELGFTSIITQYVAHESAYFTVGAANEIIGDEIHLSRLSSLMHFCIKWYTVMAFVFFIIINIIGFIFFDSYDKSNETISWKIPWIILSFGTALNLLISPLSSILSGLGRIKDVSRIIFIQQILIPVAICGSLYFGLNLFAPAIGSMISVLVWLLIVCRTDLNILLLKIWKIKITHRINYLEEVFPYQWRIALSWISGYFIFQLFNPVLFATEGAVIAGQMGMTLSVLNAIQAFCFSWQNTKVPLYSQLIELQEYSNLDSVFSRTLRQMTTICTCLLIVLCFIILLIDNYNITLNGNILGDRFLPFIPMVIMIIPAFVRQYISSWATYLRCHKREPFLASSIVTGILCCLSTLFLGKIFGLYGIVIGYCCITIFIEFPWTYFIFKNKKRVWHITTSSF